MNNYCRNCGEKLEKDIKICPKCSAEVFENRVNTEQKKIDLEKYKKVENRYVIAIIAMYATSFLLSYLKLSEEYSYISEMKSMLFFVATITLVYARINLIESTKIEIMFNVFIILIILKLVSIVLFFATCASFINRGC